MAQQKEMGIWIKQTFPEYKSISCQLAIPPTVQKIHIFQTKMNSQGRVYSTCWITVTNHGRTVMPGYH